MRGILVTIHKGFIRPQGPFSFILHAPSLSRTRSLNFCSPFSLRKRGSLSLSSTNFQNFIPSWIELMLWYPHELGTSRSLVLAWFPTLYHQRKNQEARVDVEGMLDVEACASLLLLWGEYLDSLPTYGLCESYVEIMIMLSYEIRDYRTPLCHRLSKSCQYCHALFP